MTARRNLYGRKRARPMRLKRRQALKTGLAVYAISGVSPEENPEHRMLSPSQLIGNASDCWLEIGFGNGDHLLALSHTHPNVVLLGAEPYIPGVAALLAQLSTDEITNCRLYPGDARDLLDVIPDATIGRVFLLYPDPWPKNRHAKRRFVHPDNLHALARVMKPNAELRIATDIPGYVRHSLGTLFQHPYFEWTARRPVDWRQAWPDWPGTRYESKALAEGRQPIYLTFIRREKSGSPI